jgi:hypothetical protein
MYTISPTTCTNTTYRFVSRSRAQTFVLLENSNFTFVNFSRKVTLLFSSHFRWTQTQMNPQTAPEVNILSLRHKQLHVMTQIVLYWIYDHFYHKPSTNCIWLYNIAIHATFVTDNELPFKFRHFPSEDTVTIMKCDWHTVCLDRQNMLRTKTFTTKAPLGRLGAHWMLFARASLRLPQLHGRRRARRDAPLTRGPGRLLPSDLAPILQYGSRHPSDFLAKILGVDTSPFLWNTRFYFTRSYL